MLKLPTGAVGAMDLLRERMRTAVDDRLGDPETVSVIAPTQHDALPATACTSRSTMAPVVS